MAHLSPRAVYVVNSGRQESSLPAGSTGGYPNNNLEAPFQVVAFGSSGMIGMKPTALIRDGLSNTILVSECLVGAPYLLAAGSNRGNFYRCKQGLIPPPATPQPPSIRGASWFFGAFCESWGFNTVLPPNDWATANQECKGWSYVCSSAARSWHPGGVVVAAADGSVHFVNDDIDLDIWQAYGTIAGGEVVQNFGG